MTRPSAPSGISLSAPSSAAPVANNNGPPVPATPAGSGGWLVVAGLFLFTVTWLLPLAVVAWACLSQVAFTVAGRGLVKAQALNHAGFDKGFWLGLSLAAACWVLALAAWVAGKKGEVRAPVSFGLAWLPLSVAWISFGVTWLWQTVLDRPDHDRGYAVAATLALTTGVLGSLPLLARLLTATVALLWRFGRRSALTAGVVAGASVVASLGGAAVEWVVVPAIASELAAKPSVEHAESTERFGHGDPLPTFALTLMQESLYPDTVLNDELAPADAAAPPTLPAPVPDPLPPPGNDDTARCFDALGADCGIKPCPVDVAKSFLIRTLQQADAEDVAHATLIEVCLKAGLFESVEMWRQVYYKRVNWRRSDLKYRGWNQRRCPLDAWQEPVPPAPARSDGELDEEALAAAICRLSERDQCVVRAWMRDQSDLLTRLECDLPSDGMVRKQRVRAFERLRGVLTGGA
ncbi:MAG: hypothetical protein ACOYOB_19380 [Myxococcota bacterium]